MLARLPVGGKAEVRDLESGLRFQVYRHRGDAHADVEPLTPADADTLKAIYGGEWSWKRRAAILYLDGEQIAASMNGMPHGWGDLFDNEFVGDFCIHFEGSRVHTSWREDPGHQLMVAKAAGLLVETLDASGPEALVKWAVAAVNHREVVALRYLAAQGDTLPFSEPFSRIAQPIRHITFIVCPGDRSDERLFSVGVLHRRGRQKPTRQGSIEEFKGKRGNARNALRVRFDCKGVWSNGAPHRAPAPRRALSQSSVREKSNAALTAARRRARRPRLANAARPFHSKPEALPKSTSGPRALSP